MQTLLWLLLIVFIKVYNERKQQEQKDMKTRTQGKIWNNRQGMCKFAIFAKKD